MRKIIIYGVAAIIILLLAAIAVPNFARARFTSSGEPLEFVIRVIARESGMPIADAHVQVKLKQGISDAEGRCRIVEFFPATGSVGRSGQAHLSGVLRVTAPGFLDWEQQLASLFGTSYDYFNRGTQISHVVIMSK